MEPGDQLDDLSVLPGGALHGSLLLLPELPVLAHQADAGKALTLRHHQVHHHPSAHARQVPAHLLEIHE
jgi:hypothetical protein